MAGDTPHDVLTCLGQAEFPVGSAPSLNTSVTIAASVPTAPSFLSPDHVTLASRAPISHNEPHEVKHTSASSAAVRRKLSRSSSLRRRSDSSSQPHSTTLHRTASTASLHRTSSSSCSLKRTASVRQTTSLSNSGHGQRTPTPAAVATRCLAAAPLLAALLFLVAATYGAESKHLAARELLQAMTIGPAGRATAAPLGSGSAAATAATAAATAAVGGPGGTDTTPPLRAAAAAAELDRSALATLLGASLQAATVASAGSLSTPRVSPAALLTAIPPPSARASAMPAMPTPAAAAPGVAAVMSGATIAAAAGAAGAAAGVRGSLSTGAALPVGSYNNLTLPISSDTPLVRAQDKVESSPTGSLPIPSLTAVNLAPWVTGNVTPPAVTPSGSSSSTSAIDNMQGLVSPKGYPFEEHLVVTTDGYKLRTFRIPHGKAYNGGPLGPPVLLLHGISLSSTCWVVNSPTDSLAFVLADAGFDVWMMNTRGNTFAREHVSLTVSQPAFWRFSLDQFAAYDLPNTIDYVLATTNQPKLGGFIGHSQGGTIVLAALSDQPELADKISVVLALAPSVYVRYMLSPILIQFCQQSNSTTINLLPPSDLWAMSPSVQQTYMDGVCQIPLSAPSCVAVVEGMFGVSSYITTAQYRNYWTMWPSSTSNWNGLHWAQIYNEPTPRFMKWNYGDEYDLRNIRAKVVIFTGGRDVLSAPKDNALVISRLKEGKYQPFVGQVNIPEYSHMDYIWDTGAKKRIFPQILSTLQQFTGVVAVAPPPPPAQTQSGFLGSWFGK